MIRATTLHPTPITEETFEKQGWNKETDENLDGKEYHYWILPLPKKSRDPYGPCFISNPTNQKIKGLEKGQYVVEISELNGLGFCTSEEEIEVLYEMLTKQSIYK
jgi:hypothetical protein|tara:strand:- start:101 stop:415 length:315 start_codon:yes stop_codon:yes gene_type:complete